MRDKSFSLSRRLILSLAILLVLFWALATALAIHAMREEFDDVFDSALQETTERLVPLVVNDLFHRDANAEPVILQDLPPGDDDGQLGYQVRDASGRVLLHSSYAPATAFAAPLTPGFWSDDHYRFFTAATVSGSLFVQVADSLDHRAEANRGGALSLILPVLLLLPLGMLAVLWVVRQAMAPVERLLVAIAERDGTNMTAIRVADLPRELAPIPASINRLLERLHGALLAERELASNSAHELRTPVAGALAQTELLVDELKDSSAQPRARQVLKGLRRLSVMLEKLLQLARAEAGIGMAEEPVALGGLFDLVLADVRRAHPALDLAVERSAAGAAVMRHIDPDAFGIVFKNLLENAVRYHLPGYPVHVRLTADGCISVTNATQPLAESDVNLLRQRFRRGTSSAPGSGLGLAIVDRLMLQMGGRLLLATRQAGEDTVFEAVLDFSGAQAQA
ncbi:sensor histidine kinase [Rhizobium sp. SL86]|uniref:sensor histidine kinase n=1 Tax=Rhizobium sp. SL86 TaxID=2995148 RepID=UPI002275D4EE|nr:ATP-binding protein [Rhizobium sp. SL86]MCY1668926.1 ATP-binding protein [Rhizobium sp. SL86]